MFGVQNAAVGWIGFVLFGWVVYSLNWLTELADLSRKYGFIFVNLIYRTASLTVSPIATHQSIPASKRNVVPYIEATAAQT
jgi:hypothetical protein